VRLWSELAPWERRAELARWRPDVTEDVLVLDGLDVPELRPQIEAQDAAEDRLRVVFRHFGDQRRPQPAERSDWHGDGLTPDWGNLPPLVDIEEPDGDGGTGSTRGAKEKGIPDRELWWIIRRRLEKGDRVSREGLALETKQRSDLEYVPRTRLSPLVDWVDAHKERAREALRLREIPSEFRAGTLGRVPPEP
jgi:hypothetical protein